MNKNLYVIATPIGNIKEINFLAISLLKTIKCFLCEDTRVSKKLFSLLEIDYFDKVFISYHKFNEHEKLNYAIEMIDKYNEVGLLSDAGYPVINDPGFNLINKCYENDIKINVINGPCAAIHALVVSGIPSDTFMYLGFLDRTHTKRVNQLNKYKNIQTTFVIYESVHRLVALINDLYLVFGNVIVAITKELTKKNEKIYRGNLEQIIQNINAIDLRGEFVIVLDNHKQIINHNIDWKDDELLNDKLKKPKEISKLVASKYNIKSSTVYEYLISKK